MIEYPDFDAVSPRLRGQICREMFPQPGAAHQNLHHCMRFLPHQNDDGGFFVAILRKTRDFTLEAKAGVEAVRREKMKKPKFTAKPQVRVGWFFFIALGLQNLVILCMIILFFKPILSLFFGTGTYLLVPFLHRCIMFTGMIRLVSVAG